VPVYLLQFENSAALARAFDCVVEFDRAESCTAEPEQLRLRFLAAPRPAESLLQRIYLYGGLTWCSRHELAQASPGSTRSLAPPR
jgi:hypothetical protein